MRSIESPPLVIVSGLGRCGTSMMMQMLSACGLRCAGTYPDFEPEEIQAHMARRFADPDDDDTISAEWLSRWGAVKLLDPHRLRFERSFRAIIIWLDRDPHEQAKSQLKLLKHAGVPLALRLGAVGKTARQLIREREESIAVLRGWPRIEAKFEEIVSAPFEICGHIAEFADEYGVRLDIRAMAETVIMRSGRCAPDMAIEERLLRRMDGGARSVH